MKHQHPYNEHARLLAELRDEQRRAKTLVLAMTTAAVVMTAIILTLLLL